jgi:Fe-Mn family superoxide dismutase
VEKPFFELPPLPYPAGALEPALDAQTMGLHHGKHHASYVENLNQVWKTHSALREKPLEFWLERLEQVPETARTVLRNHGGGHFNHTLFWTSLHPGGSGLEAGPFREKLVQSFGSLEAAWQALRDAGLAVFGSGWAWLVLDRATGKLEILQTANQDTPLSLGKSPLLGLDVWEHAYYLRYQNRRGDYLQALASVIHWREVERRWQDGVKSSGSVSV